MIRLFVTIIGAFNMFASISGLVYYTISIIQRRNITRNLSFLIYSLFYFLNFWLNMSLLVGFNFPTFFGSSFTDQEIGIMVGVTQFSNLVGILSFLILAVALQLELAEPKTSIKRIWFLLVFFGIITFILYLFIDYRIETFDNGFPLIVYTPSWVVNFSTFFIIVVGIWYGIQTINDYRKNYRKEYKPSGFHYLFLSVSLISFLILIFSIILRLALPLTADYRGLVFALVMATLVVFPSLRWTYIEQYRHRVIEAERNTLIDVINHDLSNIAQIIMAVLESSTVSGKELEEIEKKLILNQVIRMNELIEKSRKSVRSSVIRRFDTAER
ncbi:MAG: hypothetical protein ACFFDC_02035 [Promethearchaeota archaeon]